MGDRKSLFFTFIFEKKVVPSSNLVCNFTIKYSFGKVIEMFCSPSKFYWHLHFFLQKSVKLKKSWWSYIVNNFGFISYTTKKSALFKSYACSVFNNFSALIKTFEILSSTRNHACERFEGQLNGLQQNQAWEVLEVI